MEYPIYIKYPDNNKFVKIIDEQHWEEIVYFGKKKRITQSQVKIFSDRVYLQDLIKYVADGLLQSIDEKEYQSYLNDL